VLTLAAALGGHGLACFPEDIGAIASCGGRELIQVLEGWCPLFSGYRLYYPSRRNRRRPSRCWWRL